MSRQEKYELKLLLEERGKPKLARVSELEDSPGLSVYNVVEASRKHQAGLTPEDRAAEAAGREKDEAELLAWADGAGKNVTLSPVVQARLRLAKAMREPPADPTPGLRKEWEALTAKAQPTVQPVEPAEAPQAKQPETPVPHSRAYVSSTDCELEDINRREKLYRELHPGIGHGWGV